MKDELRCYGCGSILQTEDSTKPGFILKDVLASPRENIVCQRCFKLKNYGVVSEVNFSNEDFVAILNQIKHKGSLVVYVLDVFFLHASLIKNLDSFVGNNPIIVVLNKIDLLPKSTNINKLKNYVANLLWERNIFPIDIFPICSKTALNIDKLMDSIFANRQNKDVYIIGMANVGKSTLVNQLLKIYSNETTHFITTSSFPGTTLKSVEIPLDESTFIYDTPGIINNRSIWKAFEPSVLNKVLPKKQIKPITYQLNENQVMFLGGLAAVEYVKGPRASFTYLISNEIHIERVKSEKKETSFNAMIESKQLKPISKNFKKFSDFEMKTIEIPACDLAEVVIYGLCQFRLTQPKGNQIINVYLPKDVKTIIKKG